MEFKYGQFLDIYNIDENFNVKINKAPAVALDFCLLVVCVAHSNLLPFEIFMTCY